MFKKNQELDILFPPKNSSFQGKFLGIKFPNRSSLSLVFTIYKFTAKLKEVERQGPGSSQGERQSQSEVFFSSVFCISLVLPLPEDWIELLKVIWRIFYRFRKRSHLSFGSISTIIQSINRPQESHTINGNKTKHIITKQNHYYILLLKWDPLKWSIK